jgi:cation-transporting P-type ATPase E
VLDRARTSATITLLAAGLVILVLISRPLRLWKVGLAVLMGLSYVVVMAVPWLSDYFELASPPAAAWVVIAIGSSAAAIVITVSVPKDDD